ncbi:MAG TPA: aminotransferase class IV [Candidatus Limnocylindrales bacterium]|nr:aminotransferase class IV [Candidatus Limnocylindrales bacterium]
MSTEGLAGRYIWIDGRLEPADSLHLSAFDRGFQLGDGIFETLRATAGHATELPEHLARLRASATGLEIDLPESMEHDVTRGIAALLAADQLAGPDGDASVRITVSRGVVAQRGLLPAPDGRATIVIQAWPVTPPPAAQLERGLQLVASSVRRDPKSPLAALKTTSRADFVYARLEARRTGADDALFLTIDGHLSEATSANIFLVRGSELATPSLDCAILAGTTRTWILRWAVTAGLTVTEGLLTAADLAQADEAFLCSSVAGILPVTRFEGAAVGTGRPGPWATRARADREAFIRAGNG